MSGIRALFQTSRLEVFTALLLVGSSLGASAGVAQDDQQSVFWYRAPVPMGIEGFQQTSSRKLFYIISSAENQEFQGIKVTRKGLGGSVETANGGSLQNYPAVLNLRVTASMIQANLFASTDPVSVSDDSDMNSLLLGLRYQLKVCQGLETQVLQPSAVKMIGMPADLPADERVFRVSFDTGDIPVDARLVLEVFSPKGEKLVRFHLELL